MNEDVLVIGTSRQKDPDGSKLRAVLQSHFALERAQSLRDLFVHLLALASLPLGYLAARPASGTTLRAITLSGWLTCLAALSVATLAEVRWRRRCAALRKVLPPP
ncbi:MAG TPA: hypothetical protein VN903_16320 [Polyangia bacterium]|jgi:hypothetical protein|nr:hypothetical protein [Polyangia bacterium]